MATMTKSKRQLVWVYDLNKKRRGLDSELMDQLILYRWQDCLGHLSRDPADIVWK